MLLIKKISNVALVAILTIGAVVPTSYANNLKSTNISVERVSGKDRVDTSIKIAKEINSKEVYLVSGKEFADALSIAPMAGDSKKSIILYNEGSDIEGELKKLGVEKVVIIGGKNAIPENVFNALKKSFNVERLAGEDRYSTSEKIVRMSGKKEVGVATGRNYPDALSAGAFLSKYGTPILLIDGNKQEALPQGLKGIYTFGGKNSVALDYGKRIYGADRYETSEKIANEFGEYENVVVASGNIHADALAAAPLAGKLKAPIVLVNSKSLSENARKIITKAKKVVLVGGEKAVPISVENEIKKLNNTSISNSSSTSKSYSSSNSSGASNSTKPVKPEVKKVEVTGANKIKAGKSETYKALVTPDNVPAEKKKVTWSIKETATDKNTNMDKNSGMLTVGENETLKSITVVATAAGKEGTLTVAVEKEVKPEIEKVEVTGPDNVKAGMSGTYKAIVTPDNIPAEMKKVTWSIKETNKDSKTIINKDTGELVVGRDEKLDKITVVAKAGDKEGTLSVNIEKVINEEVKVVEVSGKDKLKVGETSTYTAKVLPVGLPEEMKKVTWLIKESPTDVKTKIDKDSGTLVIGSDETLDRVTVVAKAGIKEGAKSVIIEKPVAPEPPKVKEAPKFTLDNYKTMITIDSNDENSKEWLEAIRKSKESSESVTIIRENGGESEVLKYTSEFSKGYWVKNEKIIFVQLKENDKVTIKVKDWPDVVLKVVKSGNNWKFEKYEDVPYISTVNINLELSYEGNISEIKKGESLKINATVTGTIDGKDITDADKKVKWSLVPANNNKENIVGAGLASGTKIEDGVLTVDSNETNDFINVIATSEKDEKVMKSLFITLKPAEKAKPKLNYSKTSTTITPDLKDKNTMEWFDALKNNPGVFTMIVPDNGAQEKLGQSKTGKLGYLIEKNSFTVKGLSDGYFVIVKVDGWPAVKFMYKKESSYRYYFIETDNLILIDNNGFKPIPNIIGSSEPCFIDVRKTGNNTISWYEKFMTNGKIIRENTGESLPNGGSLSKLGYSYTTISDSTPKIKVYGLDTLGEVIRIEVDGWKPVKFRVSNSKQNGHFAVNSYSLELVKE